MAHSMRFGEIAEQSLYRLTNVAHPQKAFSAHVAEQSRPDRLSKDRLAFAAQGRSMSIPTPSRPLTERSPALCNGPVVKRAKLTHQPPPAAAPTTQADAYERASLQRQAERYLRRTLPAPILSREQVIWQPPMPAAA